MKRHEWVSSIEASRRAMAEREGREAYDRHAAAEGGCGVIGLASSVPVAGRHLEQALVQMRNRGNGKGGGVAMVGLAPEQFGVSEETLSRDYLLAIAYLEPEIRAAVEASHIEANYEIDHVHEIGTLADHAELPDLPVRPPQVVCYFVRPKADRLRAFTVDSVLPAEAPEAAMADEFVYQTTYALNREYYGDQAYKAFVLSHGRDMLVLKAVAYAEDVVRFYKLEDKTAHVWIGHHRYPTKGRVWHPGGAHPFLGMHEALVHNGDFANYAAVSSYLAQRGIYPLFQTDTEVSALVFDLHQRIYGYPTEYLIESLAPTTERDFALLAPTRQQVYDQIQRTHIHGSPDGPWFFIIAQSAGSAGGPPSHRLLGITDTSMLRPQVFALQEGEASIGLCASEKQGIDAVLASLAESDARFWPRADRYWNARGGSHTDGGAFVFEVTPDEKGALRLSCHDKFGRPVDADLPAGSSADWPLSFADEARTSELLGAAKADRGGNGNGHVRGAPGLEADWTTVATSLSKGSELDVQAWLDSVLDHASAGGEGRTDALATLSALIDRRYDSGKLRRSRLLSLLDRALSGWIDGVEALACERYRYHAAGMQLQAPASDTQCLVIRASGYEPETIAPDVTSAYKLGWRHLLIGDCRGHRFIANGLGSDSQGLRFDVYGSSGDYLASGIDGAEVHVHGSGQDQLGQIMKSGELVVHGDVGQTFMYGAKGGDVFILGNAAGRPLINAVGRPRVVINGTCLDYLAESFMAGDPLSGGGFAIVNGVKFDNRARLEEMETPYPGGNLFSLASGGAIYVRDPHERVTQAQLNGGDFMPLTDADWRLIEPYLDRNAQHFGIPVDRLLTVDGRRRAPADVYRKISPSKIQALQAEEAWVTRDGKDAH